MSRTVLITGASSGIGEETAKYFSRKGWNVAATMRSPLRAGSWANAENVICPRLDVTLPETIENAVRETIEYFGRIDVLVNNAGYALMGPLEGITTAQLEHQFQIDRQNCDILLMVKLIYCYTLFCPIDCGGF